MTTLEQVAPSSAPATGDAALAEGVARAGSAPAPAPSAPNLSAPVHVAAGALSAAARMVLDDPEDRVGWSLLRQFCDEYELACVARSAALDAWLSVPS